MQVIIVVQAVVVDWVRLRQYGDILAPWQWGLALLVGCTGVWLIFRIRAWFREDSGRADDNLKMLTQFRELHRQGGISEDEYRLIKGRLVAGHSPQSAAVKGSPTSAETAELTTPTPQKVGTHYSTHDESRSQENPPTMEAG